MKTNCKKIVFEHICICIYFKINTDNYVHCTNYIRLTKTYHFLHLQHLFVTFSK